MIWESEGGANVDQHELPRQIDELERTRSAWILAEARDDEADEFEDFDEEDFDDDFDDDFEEERDEEYEAENEEYPDDDFGTGADVDEDIGVIEIDGDIEGDFDDAEPGVVEPPEADDEEGAEEDVPEPD
jgi:hypothetical protein